MAIKLYYYYYYYYIRLVKSQGDEERPSIIIHVKNRPQSNRCPVQKHFSDSALTTR